MLEAMSRKILSDVNASAPVNSSETLFNAPAPLPCLGGHNCSGGVPGGFVGGPGGPQFGWQQLSYIVVFVALVLLVSVLVAVQRRLRPRVVYRSSGVRKQHRKVEKRPPLICVTGVYVLQPDDLQEIAICPLELSQKQQAPMKGTVVDLEACEKGPSG